MSLCVILSLAIPILLGPFQSTQAEINYWLINEYFEVVTKYEQSWRSEWKEHLETINLFDNDPSLLHLRYVRNVWDKQF